MNWDNIKYFKSSEFDSKDSPGSGVNMQQEFIERLDLAREVAGISFNINSGYRTEAHNAKVGGSANSAHLRGWAADIHCIGGRERWLIINALMGVGFSRIGIYSTFIHVDCDPTLPQNVIWVK